MPGDYDIHQLMLSRLAGLVAGRASRRAALAIVVGGAVLVWLTGKGWPWWASLPAAILSAVAAFMTIVALLYSYTKWSYPRRAAMIRARMQAASGLSEPCSGQTPSPSQAPAGLPSPARSHTDDAAE